MIKIYGFLGNELIHVRTNPGVDGAEITWKVQDETNFCTAENLLVEVVEQISDEDSTFSISFKNEQYVDYTLHDLEPNTYYRYRVCYVFADTATENVCSANVRFLTGEFIFFPSHLKSLRFYRFIRKVL